MHQVMIQIQTISKSNLLCICISERKNHKILKIIKMALIMWSSVKLTTSPNSFSIEMWSLIYLFIVTVNL